MKDKIKQIIEERIRPYLEADGGGIEFVDYDEASGEVKVQLQGACRGCPGAAMTLKMGVEAALKEEIPEISSVVAV
ncbi:MAG: NifU family protein [Deltaproteobacteria bacterium]|nr:NifU family protein [Deltaproteobacteria bacterium]